MQWIKRSKKGGWGGYQGMGRGWTAFTNSQRKPNRESDDGQGEKAFVHLGEEHPSGENGKCKGSRLCLRHCKRAVWLEERGEMGTGESRWSSRGNRELGLVGCGSQSSVNHNHCSLSCDYDIVVMLEKNESLTFQATEICVDRKRWCLGFAP